MSQIAKLVKNKRLREVPIPAGDVTPSRRLDNWDGFFAALKGAEVPQDYLSPEERHQEGHERDPFEGWRE